jgi:hypothetical protein
MKDIVGSAAPGQPKRRVSIALGLGVLFAPVVFIWFLFRAGYSAKSQIIGCVWMGVVGVALLLSAPAGPLVKALSRLEPVGASAPSGAQVTTIVDAPGGSPQLELKVGATRTVYRLLRTPVTLTNNTGSDLTYAEVVCLFYSADGKLLGNGLGNWAAVGAGKIVSGEVVASSIDLAKVSRRECKARSL